MYQNIVSVYDHIFPYKPAQRKFVLAQSSARERVLDTGCSTGTLAIALAGCFDEVVALDYSQDMIDEAQSRESGASFIQGDMRTLSQSVTGTFDTIYSFGNTLVHLESLEEVEAFFQDVKSLLSSKGVFVFQIVNYERILRKRPKALPLIDNEYIRFERYYHYDTLPHIRFETVLTVKANGEKMTGEVPLLALTPVQVKELLGVAGFSESSFYGDFMGHEFTDDSFPLVVVARG